MQLMPDTARDMARELGLAYDEARLLNDGDYNKRLGTAYLNKMLDRYDGHQALALAAYNAGPGRVDEWLQRHGDPRSGELSTHEWVERIPFTETREYTRKILRLEAASRQPEPVAMQEPLAVHQAFKSAPAAVALSLVTPLDFEQRARSEAFVRTISPESQEIQS
jgi:soluble lytic murein transglycosylase